MTEMVAKDIDGREIRPGDWVEVVEARPGFFKARTVHRVVRVNGPELVSFDHTGGFWWCASRFRLSSRDQAVESDGGSTSYYELPADARELSDLIEAQGMSYTIGNIFKACWRYGKKSGTSRLYDAKKILYFAQRLVALEEKQNQGKS